MSINFNKKDMLDIIYQAREEKIDEILKKVNKNLENRLYNIEFEEIIKDSSDREMLEEVFCNLEDNYNMKIAEYNTELYKLGFIDGINFMLSIFKESNS